MIQKCVAKTRYRTVLENLENAANNRNCGGFLVIELYDRKWFARVVKTDDNRKVICFKCSVQVPKGWEFLGDLATLAAFVVREAKSSSDFSIIRIRMAGKEAVKERQINATLAF